MIHGILLQKSTKNALLNYQIASILHVKNRITGKQSDLPPFVIFNHSQNSMHYLVCIVQDRKLAISQECLQLLSWNFWTR